MRKLAFLFAAVASFAGAQTWTDQSPGGAAGTPFWVGWNAIVIDHTLRKPLVYTIDNVTSTTIYGSNIFYVDNTGSSPSWVVQPGGNSSLNDAASCATTDTSTFLKNRHSYHQMVDDTHRGLLWQYNGATKFSPCSSGGGMNSFGYEIEHTNTSLNSWVYRTANPATTVWGQSSMVYVANADYLFLFGRTDSNNVHYYRYWPTDPIGGGTPSGHCNTAQLAAGCIDANVDAWLEVFPTGGGPAAQFSAAMNFTPPMVYVPTTGKIFAYGGLDQSYVQSLQTWLLDPITLAWTRIANGGGCTDPIASPSAFYAPIAYDSRRDRVWYHASAAADYYYDIQANTCWTASGSGGGIIGNQTQMEYDPYADKLMLWDQGSFTYPAYWTASLPPIITPVPLTVQEALPPSTTGFTRTADPVTVGIPLADSQGVSSVSILGLSGAAAGQFRCLGVWPSGNCKWALVDTLSSLTGSGTDTSISLTAGSGNFGGSNLATDNGTTITVATGTATFTVKKANFNLLDIAVVGSTTIVATGTSTGMVVVGPTSPNTTCGTCTTVYSSANDSSSTAVIEENGPVKAVIKATGTYKDGSGNPYMQFTVRLTFWKGKSAVKVKDELRNALENTSTFNSAWKGYAAHEARLAIATTTTGYAFGGRGGVLSGSYSSTEDAYLYQAYSDFQEYTDWNATDLRASTFDSIIPRAAGGGCTDTWCYPDNTRSAEGYIIKHGATSLETGTRSQYPIGWGDVTSSGGAGVMAGYYYLSGYWPKSIEYNTGGSQLVMGIMPGKNTLGYAQAWPQYTITDFYLEFHDSALASAQNDFLKLQYNLIARATGGPTYYNSTAVFPYPLPTPTEEDAYYTQIEATSNPSISSFGHQCCISDAAPSAFRYYLWRSGGGANQADFRWAYQLNFLSRGMTGRYLWAQNFYKHIAGTALARSDFAGGWRGHSTQADLTSTGFPGNVAAANYSLGGLSNWIEDASEHTHIYGIFDWYYATGDESLKDAISQGMYDRFLNTGTALNLGTGEGNSRGVGVELMNLARLHDYLASLGDSTNATTAYTIAETVLNYQVRHTLTSPAYDGFTGTDKNRGFHWGGQEYHAWDNPPATSGPGGAATARISGSFQHSILIEGLYEYLHSRGTAWSGYEDLADLTYGLYSWIRDEMTVPTSTWFPTTGAGGLRYYIATDYCNTNGGGCTGATQTIATTETDSTTHWMPYFWDSTYTGDTSWSPFFQVLLNGAAASSSGNFSEAGIYSISAAVYQILHPPAAVLQDVAFSCGNCSGGTTSYQLTFTPPAGATNLKVKWGTKTLRTSLGFDPTVTNAYTLSPSTNQTWWSATNVTGEPSPTPGLAQTVTVSTGTTGLAAANFSVKVMAPAAPPTSNYAPLRGPGVRR